MKVLYISHLHPPKGQPLENIGGMQNVSLQIVDAMQRLGSVEVETIILKASWESIGRKTFVFLLKLLRQIPAAVREHNPDIILFSSMVTAGVAPFLSHRISVPMVTINHGQDVTLPVAPYQWYLPTVFKHLDGVISVSEATRSASIERGLPSEKGVVLPNGFDFGRKRSDTGREKAIDHLEKVLGIELGGRPLLLTVGRQVRRKGHAEFIEQTLPLVRSDVNYLVIGDGPEHDNIVRTAATSSKSSRIFLAGRQPEETLRNAYEAADLFIMPNIKVEGDMEGFGIVLLEANHAGVPAVASDLEGIRDVIEQGVNGFRVPYEDRQSFAETIDKVLNGPLKALAESAVEYVDRNFTWDQVVLRYIEYLEQIVTEKQGFKPFQ